MIKNFIADGTKETISHNFDKNRAHFTSQDIDIDQLLVHIADFEKEIYVALKNLLMMPIADFQRMSDSKSELTGTYPVLLHGEFLHSDKSKTHKRYNFILVQTDKLRSAAGLPTGAPRDTCYTTHPNESIIALPFQQQCDIVARTIGEDVYSLLGVLREKRRFFEFSLPKLRDIAKSSISSQSFIEKIISIGFPARRLVGSKSKEYLIWCFLAYLRKKLVIILPTVIHGINLIEPHYRNIFSNIIYDKSHLDLIDKLNDQSSPTNPTILRIIQLLFLSSTFQTAGDVNLSHLLAIVEEVFFVAESKSNQSKLQSSARTIYGKIVDIWNESNPNKKISVNERFIPRSKIPKETNIKNDIGKEKKDPFWFVSIDNEKNTIRHHPISYYSVNNNIIQWAGILRNIFRFLKIKYTANYKSAGRLWLDYIYSLENPPTGIEEIIRIEHINDLLSPEKNTFRNFLSKKSISQQTRNDAILGMYNLFDRHIRIYNKDTKNPIDFVDDRFPVPSSRGKTPRTPLSPEMLKYITEFNARDNFSFSRSIKQRNFRYVSVTNCGHYREVIDHEGKKTWRWWPGLPVLADIMLTIPLRGFQGRWLDSGEGDEYNLDPFSLEESINMATTATKARTSGVFTKFSGELQTEQEFLGLRISTNKRLVDEDGEYSIPWCPDNVRDNLHMLLEWQKNNNPIEFPVAAEENSTDDYRAAEVDALITKVFPLFRDPINELNRPPTYQQVSTYWNSLLRAVEDELTLTQRTKFRLTRDRIRGDKTVERIALFDLHGLRVSGITALIEAGLPPSMVQEIVGHATIIMTLYYNKIHPWKVNQKIIDSLDYQKLSLEAIPELIDNLDEFSQFLINSRDERDCIGTVWLKSSIGNGTHQILSHGICPGGDCKTGGKYCAIKKEHEPLPRAGACSLCRYRFTGPMFIVGLINNANKIMSELFKKGQSIAGLNDEIRKLRRAEKPSWMYESKLEVFNRELEDLWLEWAAEVKYITSCSDKMADYLSANRPTDLEYSLVASAEAIDDVIIRSERHHHFYLYHSLAKAELYNPADVNIDAVNDRDLFLNELLANNDINPFLIRLSKKIKSKVANILGDLLIELVPEENLQLLHDGDISIHTFAKLQNAVENISSDEFLSNLELEQEAVLN